MVFLVAAKVGVHTEAATAARHVAAVRLLACMRVNVRTQTRRTRETLAAITALKLAISTTRSASAARLGLF